MSDGVDASDRMIDDWTRKIQEQAQRYQAMAARVQEISVTERSPDNTVEVRINSKGLLTGLTISDSAQGKSMSELSAQIMRTVQTAQSRIPELLQQAMVETVGAEDQTAAKVFDDARKTFPEPPEETTDGAAAERDREMRFGPEEDEEPTPPPPPRPRPNVRRRPPEEDDDDFGGRSILS
ncbi:YbaB/EbfC family nucleoid-associated protein [Saccharomonospora sp. NB11]|jgi:DNA-binding protein YbaB|uniref:YbaB/EbfC family nucleoid-associated protein n=1 Tax=Saccharomonospora sp. NB11 TaxID=1642298 RepID=UPI0018D14538|nr:YbaB/EbfC family nucleoid-associated protein [Saccharomonospora sp. NB11]